MMGFGAQGECEGKVALVTGGTAGIGLVTARELAARGAAVIIVGRDEARGARAVAEIRSRSGNRQVEFMQADLSAQSDVRRVAQHVADIWPALDILVNNAGAIFTERRLSADGIEMTLALNHLSYFLLTNLLLDRLHAAPDGRIVNVASRAHEGSRLYFDNLQMERSYNGWAAYKRSKLMNIMFTYELDRRLKARAEKRPEEGRVTVNALHPGFVASSFGTNNGMLFRLALRVAMRLSAIDVESGARTSVYVATSPEVADVSGRYFVKSREAISSAESRDKDAQARLWQESLRLTGLQAAKPVTDRR